MTDCCGFSRDTPFCSQCGKNLANGSLASLMKHCMVQANYYRRLEEKYSSYLADDEAKDEQNDRMIAWHKRNVAQHEKNASKWENWVKVLSEYAHSRGANKSCPKCASGNGVCCCKEGASA